MEDKKSAKIKVIAAIEKNGGNLSFRELESSTELSFEELSVIIGSLAKRSMKSGAEDYIPKKLLEMSLPPLLKTLRERMERHETPIHERQSAAFREIDHKIRLVAPTNMSVLVLGENGTFKEHVA